MTPARKILIFGGLLLAVLGMLYGLHYAVFVEHQTLDRMGGSLTGAFILAAQRHSPEAELAIESYASTRYDYLRQVDSHSHWIGLAMLLVLMGAIFDQLPFSDRVQLWIAIALLAGAVIFPLGVMLQTFAHGTPFGSALAIMGSTSVTFGLAAVAWGLVAKRV